MTRSPASRPARTRLASRASAALALLTPLGRGVVLLGLASAALGVWLNWHEFVQLGAVALALVLVGVLWQAMPVSPDASLTLRPTRLVEGAVTPSAAVHVLAGALPMLAPRISVAAGSRSVALRLPVLPPFGRHAEDVPLPSLPRGVHVVGPVVLEKGDPLGLVARGVEIGDAVELLVSPRVIDLAVFAGGLTNDLDGATSQQLSMSDLAFHALREYAPGDDLRHVHWRSSAKAGELLVRQYHETRRGHVTVLVDGARSSYPRARDFELAVSVATSIALRAVRDDFDTYLRCGPHVARGRSAEAMTDAGARFELGDDDYGRRAAEAADAVTGTGLVVQVTGAARDAAALDAAGRRFGHGAQWLVVRADGDGGGRIVDTARMRELTVPDLAQLRDLMARGMRG